MNEGDPVDGPDPRVAWNRGAALWDALLESGADYYRDEVHVPALLAACGDVRGRRVLDLGCGQGGFSRVLARAGARVVGVDFAEEQIVLARRHEEREPLGVDYQVQDAARLAERWPPGSFALVTACMALHDMADPAAALRGARAVLTAGGRLVFSIPHPFNSTPYRQWERDAAGRKLALKVDRYFEAGPGTMRWRHGGREWDTPYWHRPLDEWSTAIAGAGFLMRRLHEPRATPDQVRRRPDLEACARVPYFLIAELRMDE